MKGQNGIIILFVGIILAVIIVGQAAMYQLTTTETFVSRGTYTKEGYGKITGSNTSLTVLHPGFTRASLKIYVNATDKGFDAGTLLPQSNYTIVNPEAGIINFAKLSAKYNLSNTNITYDGSTVSWSTGAEALWIVVGIAILAVLIMYILGS